MISGEVWGPWWPYGDAPNKLLTRNRVPRTADCPRPRPPSGIHADHILGKCETGVNANQFPDAYIQRAIEK